MKSQEFIDYLVDNRKEFGIEDFTCIPAMIYSFGLDEKDDIKDIARLSRIYLYDYFLEVEAEDEKGPSRLMDILYQAAVSKQFKSFGSFLDFLESLGKRGLMRLLCEYEYNHIDEFGNRLEEIDY